MNTDQHTINTNRSYQMRDIIAVGSTVVFTADTASIIYNGGASFSEALAKGHRLAKGDEYTGRITGITNAGFRGIEVSMDVYDFDSDDYLGKVHGISAGTITWVA